MADSREIDTANFCGKLFQRIQEVKMNYQRRFGNLNFENKQGFNTNNNSNMNSNMNSNNN